MKRFGVILLVLALVLCVCLLGPRLLKKAGADLGDFTGGSDYGGDSDWGDSDWAAPTGAGAATITTTGSSSSPWAPPLPTVAAWAASCSTWC